MSVRIDVSDVNVYGLKADTKMRDEGLLTLGSDRGLRRISGTK